MRNKLLLLSFLLIGCVEEPEIIKPSITINNIKRLTPSPVATPMSSSKYSSLSSPSPTVVIIRIK